MITPVIPELLPCPFCGGSNVRLTSPTKTYVACDDCATFGPTEVDPPYGKLWNQRAPSTKGALTDEPAEAFKRGYEEGLNDTLRNGLDWAWLYFKGNPDRLPSKTSVHPAAPSLGDRPTEMRRK